MKSQRTDCSIRRPRLAAIVLPLVASIALPCVAERNGVRVEDVEQKGEWFLWKSSQRPFAIAWKLPYRFVVAKNTADTNGQTLISLLDRGKGSSLIAIVTPDISKDQLDDATYHRALEKQQLQAPGRELLVRGKTEFSGMTFYCLGFRDPPGPKGVGTTRVLVRRDNQMSVVLMHSRIEEETSDPTVDMPEGVASLIRVKLSR